MLSRRLFSSLKSPPKAATESIISPLQAGAASLLDCLIIGDPASLRIKETHSKVLNLGKYVFEIIHHQVKPGAQAKYQPLMIEAIDSIAEEFKGVVPGDGNGNGEGGEIKEPSLFGSWRTVVGPLDEYGKHTKPLSIIVHIVRFHNYQSMTDFHSKLQENRRWRKAQEKIFPLLNHRHSEIGLEFAFLPSSDPRAVTPGIFELRTYQLHPGKLLEWGVQWRQGIQARQRHATAIGSWFNQLGPLHRVHTIWHYRDLAQRKEAREAAWREDEWADTVAHTVPLIQQMDARIMELIK